MIDLRLFLVLWAANSTAASGHATNIPCQCAVEGCVSVCLLDLLCTWDLMAGVLHCGQGD